jgi:hypothetical protein
MHHTVGDGLEIGRGNTQRFDRLRGAVVRND